MNHCVLGVFYSVSLCVQVSSGHNVFGIVRAPRIASTEALVLVAAWRSDNVRGVAHIVMMGALMKSMSAQHFVCACVCVYACDCSL